MFKYRSSDVCILFTVGIFYFTIGNLLPKFHSKLASIQLIAIVKTKILSAYRMEAVLRPIVDDLKKLVGTTCCDVAVLCIAKVSTISPLSLTSFPLPLPSHGSFPSPRPTSPSRTWTTWGDTWEWTSQP